MKKVLIITYYWPPSGGGGVQRWLKFTKYLASYNYDPIIVTVSPESASYPQTDESLINDISTDVEVYKTKSFEPLNILSKLVGQSKVPYAGFANVNKNNPVQKVLRFIRGNFFIPDARVGWNRYALETCLQLIKEHNIQTVITTSPPHSSQLIGLKLKKLFNIKWIADFRDPWTDIYYYKDLLHLGIIKRIDAKKEYQVLEGADIVITNCNSNKIILSGKLDRSHESKFSVITNGFDESDFNAKVKSQNEFIITYSGTISGIYNPLIFFKALKRVVEKFSDVNFKLRFIGKVSPEIQDQISESELDETYEYLGYLDHADLIDYLLQSTILFYIFPETENDKGIAGKLFEYLAAKKTIVGIGPVDGDSAEIIDECEAGCLFNRSQEEDLYEYMHDLVKRWQVNGHLDIENEVYKQYSRKNLTKKLVSLFD